MFTSRNCGTITNGCYICIYFVMYSGLVKMLFCLSVLESKGEILDFLKTFLFIFLECFS